MPSVSKAVCIWSQCFGAAVPCKEEGTVKERKMVHEPALIRVSSVGTSEDSSILAGWNPLNNPYPNETLAEKLRREAREADERCKSAVKKLDYMRCKLKEAVIDHLCFMERCELDRLKTVVLGFSGAVSNVIPGLESVVDNMMLYQETVQPLGDLRYLLENYRTGGFIPRVRV
jgi:hypothetical protein